MKNTTMARAWHKKQNRFLDLNGIQIMPLGKTMSEVEGVYEQGSNNMFYSNDVELEFFIGKYDKNKQPIFDNDYVHVDVEDNEGGGMSFSMWITYDPYLAKYVGYELYTSECIDIDISELDRHELEIFGNVHETPTD